MEEIFARTLEVVSDTADVPPELILSKDRHEDVVDARCLLIFLLYAQGIYPSCISRKTGVSTRGVNYCTARFHDRLRSRNYLRNIYETTRKILGINC